MADKVRNTFEDRDHYWESHISGINLGSLVWPDRRSSELHDNHRSRAALEEVMTNLNRQFDGRRLPWQRKAL